MGRDDTKLRPAMMRRLSILVFAAALGCICFMPKRARAAETQTVHTFERTISKTVGYKYLLALPAGYDAKVKRRWPLLLFLHGSGERGDDVWTVAQHGPPKLLRAGDRQPNSAAEALAKNFIVVSPQCPKGGWWDSDALLALLDETTATHLVDESRVYLTGLSMGGFAAWDLGLEYPERFAAIAPICGSGRLSVLIMSNTHKRRALRSLAVWAFHGAKDKAVALEESQRMVDALKTYKVSEVELTVYPNAEHDSWTTTYANPELYAWLLRHQREPGSRGN